MKCSKLSRQKRQMMQMAKDKEKQKSKKEQAEQMLKYTYRDMGQEFIMRRKMWRSIIIAVMTLIALMVFIALYISEMQKVQDTYQKQFDYALGSVIEQIQEYTEADGDFDRRYRMILAEITNLNSFSFLMEKKEEEHKVINELYTEFILYPEQMSDRMGELIPLLENVKTSENDSYDKLKEFVDSIDKMGE